jgi:hypothetical protein
MAEKNRKRRDKPPKKHQKKSYVRERASRYTSRFLASSFKLTSKVLNDLKTS